MPYTAHDTPAIVTRIQSDLHHIVQVVRSADPGLQSLVLTGGFARGEGSVRGGEPQNDYDLIAIRTRRHGRPSPSYDALRARLENDLGLHMDLAPVGAWRLSWTAPSIFWYETAQRGQVLYGKNLLHRIPRRSPQDLEPTEALRLLVNRAAGLLLATQDHDDEKRLQASKALLATLDTHLLAAGHFAPSQTERWNLLHQLHQQGNAPAALTYIHDELHWAFAHKTSPDTTPHMDANTAWQSAARALIDAIPTALRHAALPCLDAYKTHDGLLDRLHFWLHANEVPGANRSSPHPTGHVRVATLRLLEASLDGNVPASAAHTHLDPILGRRNHESTPGGALGLLSALRRATLQ